MLELFYCVKFGLILTKTLTVLSFEVMFCFDKYSKLERVVVFIEYIGVPPSNTRSLKGHPYRWLGHGYTELLSLGIRYPPTY